MNAAKKPIRTRRNTPRKSKTAKVKPSRASASSRNSPKTLVKASRENSAPDGLRKLIDLVNQVPDGLEYYYHLEKLAQVGAIEKASFAEGGFDQTLDALIFQEVEKLPDNLKELFAIPSDVSGTQSSPPWDYSDRQRIRNLYESLTEGRAALAVIATSQRKQIGPFRFETWAYKDEEGRIQLDPHPILRCLVDVEADRIRRCPVCPKFFWAGHGNKKHCSDACGNVLRNRNLRQRYKERCEQERMQNDKKKLGD